MSADSPLVKRCPACGAESPPQALRCGCGTLLAGIDLTPRAVVVAVAAATPEPQDAATPCAAENATGGPDVADATDRIRAPRTCPHADCAQPNAADALRCVYCDRPLDASDAAEAARGTPAAVSVEWPWDERTAITGTLLVGRNEPALAAHCRTRYDNVSRRHAALRVDATGVWIEDLGSANGTFVNEVRLAPGEPVRLRDGARLRFAADLVATLRIGDA